MRNNRYLIFWVSALLLVIIVGLSAWFLYIPYTKLIIEQRAKVAELDKKIDDNERFVAAVSTLKRRETELNHFHQLSRLALPVKPDAEILRLQLSELFRQTSINARAEVPFVSNDSKTGSLTVQITGNLSFTQAQNLITRLRELIRWNRINKITIEAGDQGTRTTIAVDFFWRPEESIAFSGSANLLENAAKLFANFKSYATIPDIEREGSFGRDNPFDPVE